MTTAPARRDRAAAAPSAHPAGAMTEVGPLRALVAAHPRDVFESERKIAAQWRGLGYLGRPDLTRAVDEYERFLAAVGSLGAEISLLAADPRQSLDGIYVRDAAIASPHGMILGNMGKSARRDEPAVLAAHLRAEGVPVAGEIVGEGRLEGGDVVWLDDRTLAVGRGYRTNDEGIRQLGALLGGIVEELVVVPLPHWRGPDDVFHLMSMVSPLDHDLLLVHGPLLPVPFRDWLVRRGMALIEVAAEEFETMACNVLALAPRRCLMLAGNPLTRARLEAAGVEVSEYAGREISTLGGGGPTCLTRPIRRD